MITDTSREAVQALIEEAEEFTNPTVGYAFKSDYDHNQTVPLLDSLRHTLAALLDERDGALAGATTLPHEAAMAGTAGEFAARWNSYPPEKREQAWAGIRAGLDRGNACFTGMHDDRIRDLEAERDRWQKATERVSTTRDLYFERISDLEATVDNLRLISNANGDWNIKYQEVNHRAERAEAERDKLDAVKAWLNSAGLTSIYGRLDQREQQELVAILADTDEGNSK